MSARFRDANGNELPPPPPDAQPNPDWVEPEDGEIIEVLLTAEGARKAVYNARTRQIEWSPFTFTDACGD